MIRRVKTYTTRNSTGATASEISVKRQFRYSMTPMMPTRVRRVGHDAEERRGDEVLNAVDVARDPADEIAGSFLIVFGERQAMNVVIERPPQVVHDPLPDAGQ